MYLIKLTKVNLAQRKERLRNEFETNLSVLFQEWETKKEYAIFYNYRLNSTSFLVDWDSKYKKLSEKQKVVLLKIESILLEFKVLLSYKN